jgi:hypothetical protein
LQAFHPIHFQILTSFGRWICACLLLLAFLPIAFSNPYPIEVRKDFILCEATIDGQQVTLLLDSGAPGLVLNSAYYDGVEVYNDAICTGINGPFICRTHKIRDWEFLGIAFKRTNAILSDLAFLERVTGRKIHGLAGLSLFKQYYVTLNLDEQSIQIAKEDHGTFSAFQYAAHVPVVVCKIDGKTKRLGIDTGAETNYLFNYPVKSHLAGATPIKVTGTENRSFMRHIMAMEVEMVHPATSETMEFVVDASDNWFLADFPLDGLLGQAFLSQYNITIHPGKQRIRFEERDGSRESLGSAVETPLRYN